MDHEKRELNDKVQRKSTFGFFNFLADRTVMEEKKLLQTID